MRAAERYGVVGHPIAHSLSPRIHAVFAQQTGEAMRYEAFDVAPLAFAEWVREFFASGGGGLNITVPHKLAAHALVDALTPRAAAAGAVNTLLPRADGSLLGDNTDGAGLLRDLTGNLGIKLQGARILLLGAGGAARGAIHPLLDALPAELAVLNRSARRAIDLAAQLAHPRLRAISAELPVGAPYSLIVNATSASLKGDVPQLPNGAVGPITTCYDMAYGTGETAFMRWGREQGARRVISGLGMLVEQAAEAFELWRGARPVTGALLTALSSDMRGARE